MKQRNTLQKNLILQAVKDLPHPTADDIYRAVAENHPTVSRGTVYRNLTHLVSQSVLRKVAVPNAADRFDITLDDHYHIRCRVCGRVDDVSLPYQRALIDAISNTGGYLVEEHDIVLRGICPSCRTALRKPQTLDRRQKERNNFV